MSDLFRKLNVLVKAGLNDLLDTEGRTRQSSPGILGTDIDREIATLRQRVDDALKYEEDLDGRAQMLRDEVDRLDQQADAALAQGQDDAARQAVEQLQRAQQRLAMAESDLHEHRLVTQELISRVNDLEAAVSEARKRQPEDTDPTADSLERAGQVVSEVLHEIRERILEMSELVGTPPAETTVETDDVEADEAAVDDDLARRRERLSKK